VLIIPPIPPVPDPHAPAQILMSDGLGIVKAKDNHRALDFARQLGISGEREKHLSCVRP